MNDKLSLIFPLIATTLLLAIFQNCGRFKQTSAGNSAQNSSSRIGAGPIVIGLPTSTAATNNFIPNQQFEIEPSGTPTAVKISWPAPPVDRVRGVEAPPWVFKGGQFGYVITTAETSNCWSVTSLTSTSSLDVNCADVNTSSIMTQRAFAAPDTPRLPWVRNYNGIMSVIPYRDASRGDLLLTIHHGENLNEIKQYSTRTVTMQNSITQIPTELVSNCWSNYDGASSASPLDCYWGFVSIGYMPYTAASGWGSLGEAATLGPITWPVDGYTNADGTQSSRGVRHPSAILDRGYVYVFYLDASLGSDRGIRVVRALAANALNIYAWQRLSGGAWVNGTLPNGFQVSNDQIDASFYKMKSPAMDFAFNVPATERPDRFAVARLSTGGYIGVEVGLNKFGLGELGVRTSADLITWSDRQTIAVPGYNQGGTSPLAPGYALFLSAEGTTNTDVDPNGFFIIGSIFGGNSILRIPMHLVGAAQPLPIRNGAISAGTPITCDYFNPTAIKSLSTATIQWLATIQTSGLTLHENFLVARQNGYSGAFGAGEHSAWLLLDPNRTTTFNNAVANFAAIPAPPWATWADHNQARRQAGYQGLFICGGDACFQAGQCDNLGRSL